MIKKIFSVLFSCYFISLQAVESAPLAKSLIAIMDRLVGHDDSTVDIFAIPGQNGLGSNPSYINSILSNHRPDLKGRLAITAIQTPEHFPDLGQSVCIRHLREACQEYKGDKLIIYAASQGTATALNYLAQDKSNKIKALILEAVLASGNSAIFHTVTGPAMGLRRLGGMSGSYFMIPYLAKALFPRYSPSGEQAIKSIENISKDVAIVLVHSKTDTQLPYAGACAVYYRLRELGNDNTYFISKPNAHINILSTKDSSALQAILEKHQLIERQNGAVEEIDLALYQPDPAQFKPAYDAFMKKEKKHGEWPVS